MAGSIGAVGDIAARPYGWGMPSLLSEAMELNIPLLTGSDPLPFAADEGSVGRYVTLLTPNSPDGGGTPDGLSRIVAKEGAAPGVSLDIGELLRRVRHSAEGFPAISASSLGHRNTILRAIFRLVANEYVRRFG